jgi:hypothetical protein
VRKRAFISLARLLLFWPLFSIADHVKKHTTDPDPVDQETEREVWIANQLIQLVLDNNGLRRADLDIGIHSAPRFSDGLPWYEPGEDMVRLPETLKDTLNALVEKGWPVEKTGRTRSGAH